MNDTRALVIVKLIHTVVWVFFVACIAAIPYFAAIGNVRTAGIFIAIVTIEVLVLVVNRWRCPLTGVAARYTAERQDNFDIYLPLWLARHNKLIFGTLFVAGVAYTVYKW